MNLVKIAVIMLTIYATVQAEQSQQTQPAPQAKQQAQPAQPTPQKPTAAQTPQQQPSSQQPNTQPQAPSQPSQQQPQAQPAPQKSSPSAAQKKDFPPRSYRVRDNAGNLIIETEDSLLVAKMSNVKVEVIDQPLKLYTLQNDSMMDNLKFILEKKLGADAQAKAVYFYNIEWIVPGGGHVTLNKSRKTKPVLIADWKAQRWLRENVPGILDDAK
jgi:DNA mismatch repair ATPase MutL